MMAFALVASLLVLSIGLLKVVQSSIHHYSLEYFDYCLLPEYIHKLLYRSYLINMVLIVGATHLLTPLQLVALSLLLLCATGILVFDYHLKIIPDYLHFVGISGCILFLYTNDSHLVTFISVNLKAFLIPMGLIALNYLYEKKTGRWGIGQGDIKLLAWLPLLVGNDLIHVFVISLILAVILQIKNIIRSKRHEAFAFGPYIIYALVIQLVSIELYSNNLVQFQ